MAVNKVIFGAETLIDLTGDTVAPEVLLAGYTAHNSSGEPVEGAALIPDDVKAALTEKGVTVPNGAGISDLAALISGIEVGGGAPSRFEIFSGSIILAERSETLDISTILGFSPPTSKLWSFTIFSDDHNTNGTQAFSVNDVLFCSVGCYGNPLTFTSMIRYRRSAGTSNYYGLLGSPKYADGVLSLTSSAHYFPENKQLYYVYLGEE